MKHNLMDTLTAVIQSLLLDDRVTAEVLMGSLDDVQLRFMHDRLVQVIGITAREIAARGQEP